VRLEALSASLGVAWRERITRHPMVALWRAGGVMPILTRFVLEGEAGPFGIDHAATVDASYAIAHTRDAAGAMNRLVLVIANEIAAPIGRTNLAPPPDAGRLAPVGRVRAEHVFTRPFAPPGDRKVLDVSLVGGDAGECVPWADPAELLALPEDATPLEGSLAEDGNEIVFGVSHTDSNQHTNSLVYPRLFEEAAVRRLVRLGRPATVLARSVDVRFRKPSFAGDRLAIALRAYARAGRFGAVGAFVEPGGDLARPRATLRMELE
jgi:hypothetical protein